MFGTPAQLFSRLKKNDEQKQPKHDSNPEERSPADDAEKARKAEGAKPANDKKAPPEMTTGKGRNKKR